MKNEINAYIESSHKIIGEMINHHELCENINRAVLVIIDALNNNKKILLAGNGGSAADAQHIAGEFVSRFNFDRPGLAALSLTTDTSIMTAISNDYSFDYVFARQIEALMNEGDVFIGYTTSGKSKNIISAINAAKKKAGVVICLTGNFTELLYGNSDVILSVNSDKTPKIQECHAIIGHLICDIVERKIFNA